MKQIEQGALNQLVWEGLEELNDTLEDDQKLTLSQDMALFGKEGVLDSLDFVNLVMILEDLVHDKYGESITLMDEKAFSQKHNPFHKIDALSMYIKTLLAGDGQ
ncbi:hypothetical protein [Anoxynatronum buryatiense]|uniref:Carrier domain-containing protein n=1 Tax=Anoxynatronum buryatiense TaxID=489973 RepID=A0AA45WY92_9CLOT|nr:hypothetical protein [Anoxynatronum buryatiense]SMP67499.1 hypothetical protein SAMN06296020_11586 [Anoxynatronum buryatiense]